jgi:uncharacterized membrane protein YdfJ with MMPL/SSD domain
VFVVRQVWRHEQAELVDQPGLEQPRVERAAGVVTSAAAIMVAVFAVLGSLSMQDFKQLGVGLGVAILLDATIVRGVLLPSTLSLLGERTWYLPGWLSWLPALPSTEPTDTEVAPAPPVVLAR